MGPASMVAPGVLRAARVRNPRTYLGTLRMVRAVVAQSLFARHDFGPAA
jgi:hypothetical protein